MIPWRERSQEMRAVMNRTLCHRFIDVPNVATRVSEGDRVFCEGCHRLGSPSLGLNIVDCRSHTAQAEPVYKKVME